MAELSIVFIGLAVVAILIIATCVRIVPQEYNYTVERFGRYSRTLVPGIALLTPLIEQIGHKVNVMEQVMDIPSQEAFTKDNAGVTLDAVAFFQILDAKNASYQVSNLHQALRAMIMTNMRTVVRSMNLDELFSDRDTLNEILLQAVVSTASDWGVKMKRIEIKGIS